MPCVQFNDSSVHNDLSQVIHIRADALRGRELPPEGREWHYELKLGRFRAMDRSAAGVRRSGRGIRKTLPAAFQVRYIQSGSFRATDARVPLVKSILRGSNRVFGLDAWESITSSELCGIPQR